MQAEADAAAARQALYDYMKADESGKAAAQSKATEQLRKSISAALETKGLDAGTRQKLEGMLDNIDSKGEMRDNKETGESIDKLDWNEIVSKKGETRTEHINRHSEPNSKRASHGVFNGSPQDIISDAWSRRGDVKPVDDGMGGVIYNIPYENAGYESGYNNTGWQMDYVTIIVMKGTNELITAFPSFGNYTKK